MRVLRTTLPILTIGLVASGCHRPDLELFLEVDDDVVSVLIAATVDDVVEVQGFDVGDGVPTAPIWDPYVGAYEVELTALLYAESLDDLGLRAGRIEQVVSGGRPLPGTNRMSIAVVEREDVSSFEATAALSAAVAAVRIEGHSDIPCLDAGGCYPSDPEELGACVVPCPEVPEPAPPDPPTPPNLLPCAPGFEPRTLDPDIVVCEAFPRGRERNCPLGQAHFIDTDGCALIGPACPAGDYAQGVPGNPIYVAPGGTGDGTIGAPLGTIAAAIAAYDVGDVILLAKGRFIESPALDGVHVVGACVGRTTIVGVDDRQIDLRGTVRLERVRLQGNRVVVRQGANALIRDVESFESSGSGFYSETTSTTRLENVVITRPANNGLTFQNGPTVTANRLVVTGVAGHGAFLHNVRATIEDAAFDNIVGDDDLVARAFGIQGGANVTVRRTSMAGIHDVAVFIDNSRAVFEQVVVRDSLPSGPDEDDGYGFFIQNKADVEIHKSWIHQNRNSNIFAAATVVIHDTVSSNALPQAGGLVWGVGIRGMNGTTQDLRRVAVLDSAYHAIQLTGPNDIAEDIIVRRTGIQASDQREGRGLNILGSALLSRVHVQDTQGAGVRFTALVDGVGTSAKMDSVLVQRSGLSGCAICGGVCAANLVDFDGSKIEVQDARGLGVGQLSVGFSAPMELIDVVVRRTTVSSCGKPDFASLRGNGTGLQALGDVHVGSFLVEDNERVGLALAVLSGDIQRVHDGTARRNRVGMSLGRLPADPRILFARVRLVDNEIALDTP